jgi:Ca2+-binding EF-hand superfamily protein
MKKNLLFFSLILLLVGGLRTTLTAQSAPATSGERASIQRKLFEEGDTNHDGRLTEREFAVLVLHKQFSNADPNRDGKVTKADYLANMSGTADPATIEREWKAMDPEAKGYIVPSDMTRDPIAMKDLKQRFKKLDKTGKGYVTLSDLPKVSQ